MSTTTTKKRKKATNRKPKKEGWIKWNNCEAKQILLNDLEDGNLALTEADCSTPAAWEIYREKSEFSIVVFSQFKARLKGHREQVMKKVKAKSTEWDAYLHDRNLHPRSTHNHRGEQVFDMSPAKLKLRDDVADGKHTTMTVEDLRMTRPEYAEWSPDKFRRRVIQAVRLQKYYNYRDLKRMAKAKERKQYTNKLVDERNS